MSTLNTWDHFNRHVQSGLNDGQFLSAQSTLIAFGPPSLACLTVEPSGTEGEVQSFSEAVFPLGIVGRYGVNQSRQYARIWEVGSERSYWIAGHSVGQIALGRTMMSGPNLLRAAYAWYRQGRGNGSIEVRSLLESADSESPIVTLMNTNRNPHGDIRIPPGYENLFVNLASDLFLAPFGILCYQKDSNGDTVGAQYYENCVSPSYGWGADAGGTVVQENMQIQFERILPINVQGSVPLIDINSANTISAGGGAVFNNVPTSSNF